MHRLSAITSFVQQCPLSPQQLAATAELMDCLGFRDEAIGLLTQADPGLTWRSHADTLSRVALPVGLQATNLVG